MVNYPSLALLVAGISALSHAQPPTPGVTFLGAVAIPADATDRSGLTEDILPGVPHNRLGSFGSAIDWTGKGDLYVAVNDRGPSDGASDYRCRAHTLKISLLPSGENPLHVELVSTVMLTFPDGEPFVGSLTALDHHSGTGLPRRMDPEAVRVRADGSWLITEEYGPWIDIFESDGRHRERLKTPAPYLAAIHTANPEEEVPPRATTGRQANRGLESLTFLPGRDDAWFAFPQSPLLQDGALNVKNKRVGVDMRIWKHTAGEDKQYVYRLDDSSYGVNEVLALDDNRLLVLERDGSKTAFRRIYIADFSQASEVSAFPRLPDAPPYRPAAKRLFIDLADPGWKIPGPMPEKIEGLTFGPALPNGDRLLIITSDNDMRSDQPSWIWAFAIHPEALSPQAQAADPYPKTIPVRVQP
jgi:hypothetical protein